MRTHVPSVESVTWIESSSPVLFRAIVVMPAVVAASRMMRIQSICMALLTDVGAPGRGCPGAWT